MGKLKALKRNEGQLIILGRINGLLLSQYEFEDLMLAGIGVYLHAIILGENLGI